MKTTLIGLTLIILFLSCAVALGVAAALIFSMSVYYTVSIPIVLALVLLLSRYVGDKFLDMVEEDE
jgi:hypothetical protein